MTLSTGWLLVIVAYLVVVGLLVWGVNKLQKDTKSIMAAMVYEINQLFLLINTYIAHHYDEISAVDELTEVIYAKKKWFLQSKKHQLADRYELYVGLKDDINYLSDYVDEELSDATTYESIDKLFAFLFRVKPRSRALKALLLVITLGIGSGFLKE